MISFGIILINYMSHILSDMQVILLPGMDGTGILFEPLLKSLSNDVSAHVISYPSDIEQSYTQLTEFVKESLPKDSAFILVVESFSGPIGYAIAANPPINLKAVVFVATFLKPPNSLLWILKKLPLSILLKLPLPTFAVKNFLLGKDIEDHTITLLKKSLKIVKSNVLAYRIREMAKLEVGVQKIRVPCTYILSKNDKLVSGTHIEEFKLLAPEIEVIEIEGPHFILQARPQECAQIIMKLQLT